MFKHEDEPITFMEEDERRVYFPHNDPFVIKVQIGNMKVHRTLLNDGSSVDILYLNALGRMGFDVKNIHPTIMWLYGTRDSIRPLGTIQFLLTAKEFPR